MVEAPARPTRISALEGHHLGQYKIVQRIGRGGMAVVYKALQPSMNRFVAIKVLPPHLVQEEEFRARFQREAETVARLDHPNILPIYDYGQTDEIAYIVMPLVTGGTLADWLQQAPPLVRVVRVLSQILGALQHAHTREPPIIHRDIKPGNILMGERDRPLLTDFGIAKILEPSLFATRVGTLVGTPEYMAPEQSQGGPIDARTDLYALGVVLFQILTGRLSFEGPTPVMVLLQHVQAEAPAPRALNPRLSPAWDEVLRRSLAKAPADRYPTAEAMDEAIQAAWQQTQRAAGKAPAATPAAAPPGASQSARQGDGPPAADRSPAVRGYGLEARSIAPGGAVARGGADRPRQARTRIGSFHFRRVDVPPGQRDAPASRRDPIVVLAPSSKDKLTPHRVVITQREEQRDPPPGPRSWPRSESRHAPAAEPTPAERLLADYPRHQAPSDPIKAATDQPARSTVPPPQPELPPREEKSGGPKRLRAAIALALLIVAVLVWRMLPTPPLPTPTIEPTPEATAAPRDPTATPLPQPPAPPTRPPLAAPPTRRPA
ncbi:MAG TPA: protein kinase [Chloroflexota bacterium]|nr:protein kinase [Chloroflexota bacterium]